MDATDRIIEAARDLIRARNRNLPLDTFFAPLEKALEQISDSEFDDWCAEVDAIVEACLRGRPMDEDRRMEWDYSAHFNQGLTRFEAADRLYTHLR